MVAYMNECASFHFATQINDNPKIFIFIINEIVHSCREKEKNPEEYTDMPQHIAITKENHAFIQTP